jgi:hypothetical protein
MADSPPKWVAVDDLLEAARGELRSGQLVHDASFTLFNSMAAIQVSPGLLAITP